MKVDNTWLSDENIVFVCQDRHVLDKFKKRYINATTADVEDEDCTEKKTSTDTTFLGRVRRDLFPSMAIENKILDVVLGVGLFWLIWFYVDIEHLSSDLMTGAVYFANFLDSTLSWLGAAPAGLKLNAQFVQFLELFFKYHIHLFKGYLLMISPYLPVIIYSISLTSLPGLTCFLSYVLSFSVIFLLHVHCFYAYACNLYSAQLKALISLGRLFAGVKYNRLRGRVDSVNIHGDQLILGTLIFSTLLFLFPTTVMYYCVFSLVNLLLVLLQMCIVTGISVIRSCPIGELIKILRKDSSAVTDVMIEPLASTNTQTDSHTNTQTDSHTNTDSLENANREAQTNNVFVVTAVYRKLGSCLRQTQLGNHKLNFKEIRTRCFKGEIIKISF